MFGVMNTCLAGESMSTSGTSQSQPQKDQGGLILNVMYSDDKEKSASQNRKHERFLKKRKYLERKGLLKSDPYQQKRAKAKAALTSRSTESSAEVSQQPKVVFRSDAAHSKQAKAKVKSSVGASVSGKSGTQLPETKPKCVTNQVARTLLARLNIPALPPAVINTSKFVAIDCEMVGGGPRGQISMLARCSLVSYEGDVVFDEFIRPDQPVTCYRTRWSGIRPRDLNNAMPFQEAKKLVAKLLHGKVVVGHAIHHDFQSLAYVHPPSHTRDTQKIPLLNLKCNIEVQRSMSLKAMSKAILNQDIQTGKQGHSSLEDAQATMKLYRVVATDWEKVLASGYNFWAAFKVATTQ